MISIQGRVLNEETDQPLARVDVRLLREDAPGKLRLLAGAESDAEGSFRLQDEDEPETGRLRIQIILPSGLLLEAPLLMEVSEHLVVARVHPREARLQLEDRLPPGRLRIRGRVLFPEGDWGTSLPLRGAAVTILDTNPDGSRDAIFSGTTDDEGQFSGLSASWQGHTEEVSWDYERNQWNTQEIPMDGDILDLVVALAHDGREVTMPFLFSVDDVQVSVRVDWAPRMTDLTPLAEVNGEACYSTEVLVRRLLSALSLTSQPLVVHCYGGTAQGLQILRVTPFSAAVPGLAQRVAVLGQAPAAVASGLALSTAVQSPELPAAAREIGAALLVGCLEGRTLHIAPETEADLLVVTLE